jgi:hypothetical protein
MTYFAAIGELENVRAKLQEMIDEFQEKKARSQEFAAAVVDGLQIAGEDQSEVAPFYRCGTESRLSGPIRTDEELLRDAERNAKRNFKVSEETEEEWTAKPIWIGKNDHGYSISINESLWSKVQDGISWRFSGEDGFGRRKNQTELGEELLRNVKAKLALTQAVRKESGVIVKDQGKQIKNKDLIFVYSIGPKEQLTLRISKAGQVREIQAWRYISKKPSFQERLFDSTDHWKTVKELDFFRRNFKKSTSRWEEVFEIAGMEFPLSETAREKDLQGKWRFDFLPSFPMVVGCLRSEKHREVVEKMYETFDQMADRIRDEDEQKVAVTYIELDITDIIEMLPNDDETIEFTPIHPENDLNDVLHAIEDGTDISCSPVDVDWAAKKVNEIIEECDPDNTGVICKASKSREHRSVKETLRWLYGHRQQNKIVPGFVSNPALGFEQRSFLLALKNPSYQAVKEKEFERQFDIQEMSITDIEQFFQVIA